MKMSIIYARQHILPELIDLIKEHGEKNWNSKAPCKCCGEKIYEDKPKEGVIGTSIGCFCADCIEEFLSFVFK